MSGPVSRRLFLGGLLSGAAGAALAAPPAVSLRPVARGTDLRALALPSPDKLVAGARLGGAVGFAVADLSSGEVLEETEAARGLPPASVAKAVTALYALDALGPGHSFTTRVLAAGPLRDGAVQGDLILAGGGDPTLDTDGLAELAQGLKAAGVREVRGRFRVWGGALPFERVIDPSQPDHVGYNPALSGLNLNFNRVHFEWRRSGGDYAVTLDARSARYRPNVRVARMAVAVRDVPVYTYEDAGGRDNWTVARGALGSGGARWLPVRKPELYAGEVFQTFAGAHGIRLGAPEPIRGLPQGATELAARQSAPLREILGDMLRYSTNLTAEVVGMSATAARGASVPSLAVSAREMSRWAGQRLGMGRAHFVDHSGLGDASRVTAGEMVTALAAAERAETLRPILKEIKLRDSRGRPVQDHSVTVRAKTGTLHFVSALAGYIDVAGDRELAFAILTADTERRAGLSRAERERPEGARAWNGRSRRLQQALIERWGVLYGA